MEMTSLTKEAFHANACKAVMAATKVALQGLGMLCSVSQRTDAKGQMHVKAFGIEGEGDDQDIECVVEIIVREPYRE